MNSYIKQEVEKIYNEIIKHRRYLHQNPELSEKEYNTNKYVANFLKENNIEYKIVADTGIYAWIKNGGDKVLAFRADMDALPINEQTGLNFLQ